MDTSQTTPTVQNSLVPVAANSAASLQPYHRAATLMAGATPGAGGVVRVWAPVQRPMWKGMVASAIGLSWMLYIILHSDPWLALYPAFLLVYGGMIHNTRGHFSPCYITTDDTGIAITIPGGSRSFQWSDVDLVECNPTLSGRIETLVVCAPDPIRADLTGYPARLVDELCCVIKERAHLVQHPRNKSQWIRGARLQALIAPVIAGIGLTFERNVYNRLVVAAVEDHSPAGNVGLMSGDEILAINHLTVERLDEVSAADECIGPEGLIIHLKVTRELWVGELEFQARTKSPFC